LQRPRGTPKSESRRNVPLFRREARSFIAPIHSDYTTTARLGGHAYHGLAQTTTYPDNPDPLRALGRDSHRMASNTVTHRMLPSRPCRIRRVVTNHIRQHTSDVWTPAACQGGAITSYANRLNNTRPHIGQAKQFHPRYVGGKNRWRTYRRGPRKPVCPPNHTGAEGRARAPAK